MSTLLLIRHGQASYGAANYDVLSDRGRLQADRLGTHLAAIKQPIDALYSGPLERQRDTATRLRATAMAEGATVPELEIVDQFSEYDAFNIIQRFLPRLAEDAPELRPLLDGSAGNDAMRLLDRAFELAVTAWSRGHITHDAIESYEDFTARVRAGLERVLTAHGGGQTVAVVSSGGPISITVGLALGLAPDATMAIGRAIRNASITELRWRSRGFAWRPGDFSLYGFNHVPHLEAEPGLVTYR